MSRGGPAMAAAEYRTFPVSPAAAAAAADDRGALRSPSAHGYLPAGSPRLLTPGSTSRAAAAGRTPGSSPGTADLGRLELSPAHRDTSAIDSIRAPAGDVTHGIYKALEGRRSCQSLRRSRSDGSLDSRLASGDDLGAAGLRDALKQPQGFRRWHAARVSRGEARSAVYPAFLDALLLTAGASPEAGDDDAYSSPAASPHRGRLDALQPDGAGTVGGLSDWEAFCSMMKGIVGSGVLTLPRAFADAGFYFALASQFVFALLTGLCIILLMRSRSGSGVSYADVGREAYGDCAAAAVKGCLITFQCGLLVMYLIFMGQTTQDVVEGWSGCAGWARSLPLPYLIAAYAALESVMVWVRRMRYLAWFALVADVCIVAGLSLVLYHAAARTASAGPTIVPFRPGGAGLFIGASALSFEGIAVMVPIHDAMAHPAHFDRVMWQVVVCCCALFCGIGAAGAAAWGDAVEANVLGNIGGLTPPAQLVGALYTAAIACTLPLQGMPVFRIVEDAVGLAPGAGKRDPAAKWAKNALRALIVGLLAVGAVRFSDSLHSFVALIGGVAGVPLGFVFPPLFHLRLARRRGGLPPFVAVLDAALAAAGCFLCYTATVGAAQAWAAGAPPPPDQCAASAAA